jgi:hypothetical protein
MSGLFLDFYGINRRMGSATVNGDNGGAPDPTGGTLPLMTAYQADSLADIPGANTHRAYNNAADQYSYQLSGPNYASANAAIIASLQYCGIRHIREQIAVGSSLARTNLPLIASNAGVDIIFTGGTLQNAHATPSQLVTEASTYYSGITAGLEGLNETDGSNISTWISDCRSYQQTLAPLVRSAGFNLLGPSMAFNSYSKVGSLSGYVDINNVHCYPGGQAPSVNMDLNVTNVKIIGGSGKPVWFTEVGYENALNTTQSNPPVPEDVAGVYAPKEILEAAYRGIDRAYFYELCDLRRNDALNDREKNFGLFRWGVGNSVPSWDPKPAATSLKNLVTLFSDPGVSFTPTNLRCQLTGGDSTMRSRLYQKRNGEYYLALWRDVSSYTPKTSTTSGSYATVAPYFVTVTLETAKNIDVYQPSTSSSVFSSSTGVTSKQVRIGEQAIIVKIS